MKNDYKAVVNRGNRKLYILIHGILVGILASVVVVLYRLALGYAEDFAFWIYDIEREKLWLVPIFIIILGIVGYIVGKIVEKNPMVSGSGIPQTKGVLLGYLKNNWITTIVYKFIGGVLSIGSGLSLGREGPSVQLGASVGEGISKKLKCTRVEKKILISSGGAAGLAAAFNAPLAGVMFALEEIYKYFSPLVLLSTMAAAVSADFVSKQIFGIKPVFNFGEAKSIPLDHYWVLIILGIVLGLLGAFYNKILLLSQKLYKKIEFVSMPVKNIIPFVTAGILGIVFPYVLCGGHRVIEELHLETTIPFLLLLLIMKFLFSMISFGSGSPGGIFFPLLIIGATIGAIFGNVSINFLGIDSIFFNNFIILAMAGYFTAIVRAPITGVILITEMTGSFSHLLSLTIVSITAYIVADLTKSKPVYDSLLENQLKGKNIEGYSGDDSEKIVINAVVHYGSDIAGKKVRDISWPSNTLVLSIKRGEEEILPRGNTEIKPGDYLVIIADLNKEAIIRKEILELTTYE